MLPGLESGHQLRIVATDTRLGNLDPYSIQDDTTLEPTGVIRILFEGSPHDDLENGVHRRKFSGNGGILVTPFDERLGFDAFGNEFCVIQRIGVYSGKFCVLSCTAARIRRTLEHSMPLRLSLFRRSPIPTSAL